MMVELNQSAETDGLDDLSRLWLQRIVRVKSRPDWGLARVIRWYPAVADQPERLRIMAKNLRAQQMVSIDDIEVIEVNGGSG